MYTHRIPEEHGTPIPPQDVHTRGTDKGKLVESKGESTTWRKVPELDSVRPPPDSRAGAGYERGGLRVSDQLTCSPEA